MIGRNNQEEEDGCENQAALSVLRAALRLELCRGRGGVGGERNPSKIHAPHTHILAPDPLHSPRGVQRITIPSSEIQTGEARDPRVLSKSS